MPRVHYVEKSRKDYPGIPKGSSYYWWKFPYGGKRRSLTRPRQSQLTQSDKLSRFYMAEEMVADAGTCAPEDMIDVLQEAADELQEVADEYRESAENIREHFQDSPTADECDERAENIETTIESLEQAIGELQELTLIDQDETERDEEVEAIVSQIEWSI